MDSINDSILVPSPSVWLMDIIVDDAWVELFNLTLPIEGPNVVLVWKLYWNEAPPKFPSCPVAPVVPCTPLGPVGPVFPVGPVEPVDP
jgi:hypothetical protein